MKLALVAASLLSAFLAGSPASGLRGVVMRGPIRPVCQAGIPCSAPAKHVVLQFTRGRLVKTVRTDEQGRYRIVLAPGTYAVAVKGKLLRFSPRTAIVVAGKIAVRNFAIDTGIR